MQQSIQDALHDLASGLKKHRVWTALASEDIGDAHKRTTFGPLWLLIDYLAWLALMVLVLGRHVSGDVAYPIGYMATGLLAWRLVSETLASGLTVFISEAGMIKGTVLPLTVYVMRQNMRLLIRMQYVTAGAILVLLITGVPFTPLWLTSLAGIAAIAFLAPAATICLGFIGALFPDSQFFMHNIIRLGMFATPIFWTIGNDRGARAILYHYNPFTYFIEIVRMPIIDGVVPLHAWAVCLLTAPFLWGAAILMLARYRRRVVFMI